tara:strand:+ start:1260 stop:1640 length:381 start_codon:yes stop_codon:yes gene_type:complete
MEENMFDVTDIDEAAGALAEAVAYQKENENPTKLLVHTSGWLTSSYARLSGKEALTYFKEAWKKGQEAIDTYEWIESGKLTVTIHALNFGIVIGVDADVIRCAESQAQQDKQKEMMAQIYGEDIHE